MLKYRVSFTFSIHSFIYGFIVELKPMDPIYNLNAHYMPGMRHTRFVKGITSLQGISQFSWSIGT